MSVLVTDATHRFKLCTDTSRNKLFYMRLSLFYTTKTSDCLHHRQLENMAIRLYLSKTKITEVTLQPKLPSVSHSFTISFNLGSTRDEFLELFFRRTFVHNARSFACVVLIICYLHERISKCIYDVKFSSNTEKTRYVRCPSFGRVTCLRSSYRAELFTDNKHLPALCKKPISLT